MAKKLNKEERKAIISVIKSKYKQYLQEEKEKIAQLPEVYERTEKIKNLVSKRNKAREELDDISNILAKEGYSFSYWELPKPEEIAERVKNQEVKKRINQLQDWEEIENNLIISQIEEDFDVNSFVEKTIEELTKK